MSWLGLYFTINWFDYSSTKGVDLSVTSPLDPQRDTKGTDKSKMFVILLNVDCMFAQQYPWEPLV